MVSSSDHLSCEGHVLLFIIIARAILSHPFFYYFLITTLLGTKEKCNELNFKYRTRDSGEKQEQAGMEPIETARLLPQVASTPSAGQEDGWADKGWTLGAISFR